MFQAFIIQHSPQHVKLCGVLFRNAHVYMSYPIVNNFLELHKFQEEPHLWAWQAWAILKNYISSMYDNSIFTGSNRRIRIQPFCFKCFIPTDRTCITCRSTCKRFDLRLVPTCQTCQTCRACAKDKDFPLQDKLQFRYSFHLSSLLDQMNQSVNTAVMIVDAWRSNRNSTLINVETTFMRQKQRLHFTSKYKSFGQHFNKERCL